MAVIFSRAPLRISLGGGGTDLPSYYRAHEGYVIAGAIDKYVYMLVHTVFQKRYRMKYSMSEEVDEISQIRHPILRETLARHWTGAPLEIAVVSDVPAGTGLGSSGAFTVCLLKALARARCTSITPGGLAEAACEIEIDVLSEPVGKQDQYVAAHGGICAYKFCRDGSVQVEALELSSDTMRKMRDHLLLFYCGEVRSASRILADQDRRSNAGEEAMLGNLHRMKELANESRELLLAGDLEGYAKLMHEHWEHKRRRSEGITNPRVDTMYRAATESGAIGGKLVGAGGGGFLLVYTVSPDETRDAMAALDAVELPFSFEFGGADADEYS
jgi:D-glycero-alpha-D-manno-heptose-7-phosphate kinase